MRFAWLRENTAGYTAVKPGFPGQFIFVAYNVIWWIPLVLVITGTIDYYTGSTLFALITLIRAGANLYRNNVLSLERAEFFPLRAP